MNNTQLITFGNHIRANANQTVIDALATGDNGAIANWYNQQASPDFYVFVHSVMVDEVRRSLDWAEVADDTTFTAQRQWMFNLLFANGDYDPSEENNRDALIKIFPATMPNCRSAVLEDATRKASEARKLFAMTATGPGGGNGSAPAQSAIDVLAADVNHQDVAAALTATE